MISASLISPSVKYVAYCHTHQMCFKRRNGVNFGATLPAGFLHRSVPGSDPTKEPRSRYPSYMPGMYISSYAMYHAVERFARLQKVRELRSIASLRGITTLNVCQSVTFHINLELPSTHLLWRFWRYLLLTRCKYMSEKVRRRSISVVTFVDGWNLAEVTCQTSLADIISVSDWQHWAINTDGSCHQLAWM